MYKCERKVVKRIAHENENLMHSLCLQTEPTKENWRMWTCNRVDLQTLGWSQPVMPKNLPDHLSWLSARVWSGPMIEENRQLVTNEPVEVKVCRKINKHFRRIHGIYPHLIKENRRMSTCNWVNLQRVGSQLVMPKNVPDHWVQA